MLEFWSYLKFDLLLAQPQTFICLYFCLSFFDPQPRQMLKRAVILSFIHSVYTDVFVFILPIQFHILNSIIAGIGLIFLLFRELPNKKKLLLFIFWYMTAMIMDLISSFLITMLMEDSMRPELLRKDTTILMEVVYPQAFLLLVISWFIRNKNSFSARQLFAAIMNDGRKNLTSIIVLISVQFLFLGILQLIQLSEKTNLQIHSFLILLTSLFSLLALVFIIRLLIRTREQAAKMTQEVYVDEISSMFTSIRGQRHDFLNHLQVIHSMVQMNKTDQLKNYVGELVSETRDVSEIVHHASPALAAFAQAKTTVALGKGISFTCELPDDRNVEETVVRVIDIIKIIGNLVDNAFDESEKIPANQRKVHAKITVNENQEIELFVSNHGRIIHKPDMERIFTPDYSSKGDGHSGLGLAIVTERVKHYNGKLVLKSDFAENQDIGVTIFLVTLPHVTS